MRQLGSKLLAGGLSAGVILLWWPMFFSTDSVTTWLLRGIAWTLCFELLLHALSPFELALWSTSRGERLTRKVQAGRALLEHESPRRRIGRRAGLAIVAITVPLVLIAVGVSSHIPVHTASAAAEVTQVTRVVRVVKPVRVQRVVKIRTVSQPVVVPPAYTAPSAAVKTPARRHVRSTPKHTRQLRPVKTTPAPQKQVHVPETQTAPSATAPATGAPDAQTQPNADQSGAAAQPAT